MKPCSPPDCAVTSARWRVVWATIVPAFLAVAALLLLHRSYEESPALLASSGSGADQDQDGLPDYQELILGTDPTLADTDSDTYGDLEEVARQSDPLQASSIPGISPANVGLFAREEADTVTFGSVIYSAGVGVPRMRYNLGIVIDGARSTIPHETYQGFTDFSFRFGRDPGSILVLMESHLPRSLVWSLGKLAVYATLTEPNGSPDTARVDVINLTEMDGVLMAIEAVAYADPGVPTPHGASTSGPTGLIYIPLTQGEDLPSSFTAGQVCWQSSSTVGVNGPSFVQEVVDAECEPSESHCSNGGCQGTVGQLIEIVDPGLLIGG